MDIVRLRIPYRFIRERARLSWHDVRFGFANELIDPQVPIDCTVERLAEPTEPSAWLLELAGADTDEPTLPLVSQLAAREPQHLECESHDKWLYLVLTWIYDHRGEYSDPPQRVELVCLCGLFVLIAAAGHPAVGRDPDFRVHYVPFRADFYGAHTRAMVEAHPQCVFTVAKQSNEGLELASLLESAVAGEFDEGDARVKISGHRDGPIFVDKYGGCLWGRGMRQARLPKKQSDLLQELLSRIARTHRCAK